MNTPPTMPSRVPTFWRLLLLLKLLLPLGFKDGVLILCLPVDVAGDGREQRIRETLCATGRNEGQALELLFLRKGVKSQTNPTAVGVEPGSSKKKSKQILVSSRDG